jgi:hypothetical protein
MDDMGEPWVARNVRDTMVTEFAVVGRKCAVMVCSSNLGSENQRKLQRYLAWTGQRP